MEPGKEILTAIVRDYVSPWEASQLAGSYWDVVATAIGIHRFVAGTQSSLGPEKLGKYAQGYFRSPLHLRMAVEGLAANDLDSLKQSAAEWPSPAEISAESWWWNAAWSAAMRHLKPLGVVTLDDFLVSPNQALMFQAMELWEDPDLPTNDIPGARTIEDAASNLLPTLLGQRQKMAVPPDPSALLRRLRGHEHLLSGSTCVGIAEQIETWTENPEKSHIYLPVLLDIGRVVCPAIVDDARVSLAERLPFCASLTDWCEECLILLTDWQLP